jgi:hypothetical protein
MSLVQNAVAQVTNRSSLNQDARKAMEMEQCAQCHALERHLKAIGVEYLCATQQRDIERQFLDGLRQQLDQAEARLDQHLAVHDSRHELV